MARSVTLAVVRAAEVTTTCASNAEAERIVEALLAERLVACGQWWPISSRYRWRGEVHADDEVMLVVKTSDERHAAVVARLRELHSYELPVVTAHLVSEADPDVLAWLAECLE